MKTTRLLIVGAAALLLLAGPAAASGDTEIDCNGNGSCATTNNSTTNNTTQNVNSATGGTGVGIGVGKGGDGGNATIERGAVKNKNENTNLNLQGQKQQQGQIQGQHQSSYSKSEVDDSGNSYNKINIEGDDYRRQTPPAFGVPLAVGNEVCAQSQTAGGSSPIFGFSLGITHDNEGCNMRRNAAMLIALKQPAAAVELLCQDDDIRAAMVSAGTPCAADRPAETPVAEAPPSTRIAVAPMVPIKD